jgi:hypothetical protein
MNPTRAAGLCAALIASAVPAAALAAPEWLDKISFSGYVQSDIRFDIEDYRGARSGDGYKFSTTATTSNLRLEVTPIEQLQRCGPRRRRYTACSESNTLAQTTDAASVDPFSASSTMPTIAVRGCPSREDLKLGRKSLRTWARRTFQPHRNINGQTSRPDGLRRKVPNKGGADLYPTRTG